MLAGYRSSLENLKPFPGAYQHKLCLGCIQSQPITDINESDLHLNKRQYNRYYQKQRLDECHPHTNEADYGTENLGGR